MKILLSQGELEFLINGLKVIREVDSLLKIRFENFAMLSQSLRN